MAVAAVLETIKNKTLQAGKNKIRINYVLHPN